MRRFMRVCALVALLACHQTARPSDDVVEVLAGMLPISVQNYRMVLLVMDGGSWQPEYCDKGWQTALIRQSFRRPDGPWVDNVGCWGVNLAGKKEGRYYDIALARVIYFPIDTGRMEWFYWMPRENRFAKGTK